MAQSTAARQLVPKTLPLLREAHRADHAIRCTDSAAHRHRYRLEALFPDGGGQQCALADRGRSGTRSSAFVGGRDLV